MGSSGSEMHGSPQAVFTSFKLPKPGSMDIRAQEKTFATFIKMSVWGTVISILILIVMALSNA